MRTSFLLIAVLAPSLAAAQSARPVIVAPPGPAKAPYADLSPEGRRIMLEVGRSSFARDGARRRAAEQRSDEELARIADALDRDPFDAAAAQRAMRAQEESFLDLFRATAGAQLDAYRRLSPEDRRRVAAQHRSEIARRAALRR